MDLTSILIVLAMVVAVPVGVVIATLVPRFRDVMFLAMVFGTAIVDRLDVNFVSREWYRGTTRGFEVSYVDLLAVIVLASLLLRPQPHQRRWYWVGGLAPLVAYFGFCGVSVLMSDPMLFGAFELSKVFRGIIVLLAAALYVRGERELRVLLWALCLTAAYQGVMVLKMRYLDGVHRVPGTLGHPNSLSMFMCMLAPVFVAAAKSDLPRKLRFFSYACAALAVLAVILTISRTGVVTVGVVMLGVMAACFRLRFTVRQLAVSAVVLVAMGAVIVKSWGTITSRFSESTLGTEFAGADTEGRGYYLRLAGLIIRERFFGVGLNNWSFWVSNEYGPRLGMPYIPYVDTSAPPVIQGVYVAGSDAAQAAPAHNLGALTIGELGWIGLFLFAIVWGRWLQMGLGFLMRRTPDPLQRVPVGIFFGLCAVLLQSITEWIYRQTPIHFMLHILMGALASLYYIRMKGRRGMGPARQAAVRAGSTHATVRRSWS